MVTLLSKPTLSNEQPSIRTRHLNPSLSLRNKLKSASLTSNKSLRYTNSRHFVKFTVTLQSR